MRKLLVKTIEGCLQCDYLRCLGWGNYVCAHFETKGMKLEGKIGFPAKCPLKDVPEDDIVEPGC